MQCGSRNTARFRRPDAALGIIKALAIPTVILLLYGSAVCQIPPADQTQDPAYRLSVDVNLVVLHATVRDRQGRFAADLREENFQVYEDGVPQHIRVFQHEDIPVTVGLVVDHSGSMRPKLREVTTAAESFVRFSNPEDQMFVVNFNETVSLGLDDTIRFSNDPATLGGAIWRSRAFGETALYDAAIRALERLQEGHWDKKVLLVISDGGDNASSHSLAQVTNFAGRSSAIIYTIGIFDETDADRNPRALRHLAQATGGEAFSPGQASEVASICERIAREIRNQYTVGYVPATAARSGAYRTIRVGARASGRGKLFVRTRTGYIAGGVTPIGNGAPK
jgi:Ca-activated chloride channel homolog